MAFALLAVCRATKRSRRADRVCAPYGRAGWAKGGSPSRIATGATWVATARIHGVPRRRHRSTGWPDSNPWVDASNHGLDDHEREGCQNPEGCQNDVHSGCGSVVLVHETAETIAAVDVAVPRQLRRSRLRRLERECAVGALVVVALDVDAGPVRGGGGRGSATSRDTRCGRCGRIAPRRRSPAALARACGSPYSFAAE
jgi:hypothetical protein